MSRARQGPAAGSPSSKVMVMTPFCCRQQPCSLMPRGGRLRSSDFAACGMQGCRAPTNARTRRVGLSPSVLPSGCGLPCLHARRGPAPARRCRQAASPGSRSRRGRRRCTG
ncbi:hypothetical protein [Ornithinimicrobium kibberense]|uniref:hypothetical protein n=1 Tax=Ornithinimicrobium kibberense TaxID=282060 RepID=UPI00360EEC1D